jgi:hypothetical protein
MKRLVLAGAAAAVALAAAGSAAGRPQTTNAPAIFTVKVTIHDRAIAMSPNHAVRGSMITFIVTNRGTKTHTFVIGDARRGQGLGQGFKQTLRPNQQFTKVMFLDYRGVMRFYTRTGGRIVARGSFKIS